MKKWVSLAVLAVVAVSFMGMEGCEPNGDYPDPTNVQWEVVTSDDGASINITWSAPADADPDDYIVNVDGTDLTPIEGSTETTVSVSGAEVTLYARYGDELSNGVEIDLEAVTSSIDIYTTDDPSPDHPSGFGFEVGGSAQTYALGGSVSDYPSIDYILFSGHVLIAPMDYETTDVNDKGSAASNETGAFDDLSIASAPGNYSTQRALSTNGLYGLWLDDANDGYDASDHFGKLYVTGIAGEQASVQVAYQGEAGLRWVDTDATE